jgi:AcrR family transcriptional regulator
MRFLLAGEKSRRDDPSRQWLHETSRLVNMGGMSTIVPAPDAARRSERSYRAIVDATKALLDEQGYAATSIDQIARRAGVGKQTIYRWWPNKAAVVLEAHAEQAAERNVTPDTGDLRDDLRAIAAALAHNLGDTAIGRVCVELIGEAQADERFAEAYRDVFVMGRRAAVRTLLERGRERGEVRGDVDLELAMDMFFGPIWYRRLVRHAPLTREFAHSLADALVDAVGTRPAAAG